MKRLTQLSVPSVRAAAALRRLPAANLPAVAPAQTAAAADVELLPLLKRFLALLRSLEESLVQGRSAILCLNSDGILKAATEQQSICLELQRVQKQLITAGSTVVTEGSARTLVVQLSSTEAKAAGSLRRELTEIERKVKFAAQVNAAVLQRSSRTAVALRNLYLSCLGTYANPAASSSAHWRL